MTGITTERVIALSEASQYIPTCQGKRVHYSTLYRWIHKGARGRRLEVFHRGGRVFTSIEALNRFFVGVREASGASLQDRNHSICQAETMLDAEGI